LRVAQGAYAIGFPADADVLNQLEGAPIKWIAPKEGVNYTVMVTGLVKNAPRSNAAKLFINFVLSEEFQQIVAQTDTPVRMGIKPARPEWSLDQVSLLPRDLIESREERERFYRLAESIYGLR
jgi:iron(III) transport system substrate-binding protein